MSQASAKSESSSNINAPGGAAYSGQTNQGIILAIIVAALVVGAVLIWRKK